MIDRLCERTHILENLNIVIPGHEWQWLPRSQLNSRDCNYEWLFLYRPTTGAANTML